MNSLLTRVKLSQSGVVLPGMVLIMLIITFSTLGLATFAVNHFARTSADVFATNTLLVAEAGAEQTLYQLNLDSNFTGYSSEQEFFNNSNQGRATYQTEVVNGSISNEKLITSTGRVYRRPTDTTPSEVRKVRLTVVGTTTGGYSVHTGPGGLILSNSATIANGDVYINGYLNMSNSSRIGSAENPLNVSVAHVNCPPGGGTPFPVQCSSGQPITITSPAHIYGTVCATNQANGSNMSNPGLQPGCSAPAVALPGYDREAHKAATTNEITGSAASCGPNQTRTYQANTKINGDVNISNNCRVTVLGNLWITGHFNISNSAEIRVAESVTETVNVMVDGAAVYVSNNSKIIANATNVGFQFITYRSSAACSPDCADVVDQDLFNSKDLITISINNGSLAAGSIFYSRWTKSFISNSGSIGGVIGQTVELSNSGNITFGTNLSSGQSVWSIKNYSQVFD